jgi:hypothetical protein
MRFAQKVKAIIFRFWHTVKMPSSAEKQRKADLLKADCKPCAVFACNYLDVN